MTRKTRSPESRFWANVRVTDVADPDACWLWTAGKSSKGYGYLDVNGRQVRAHIFAYELLTGPVPPGLQLDHLCHNRDKSCKGGPTCIHRRCVNPDHLEPVTCRTNLLRGNTLAAKNAANTHCPAGHAFTPENTYVWQGGRKCRVCHRAHAAASRKRALAPIEAAHV